MHRWKHEPGDDHDQWFRWGPEHLKAPLCIFFLSPHSIPNRSLVLRLLWNNTNTYRSINLPVGFPSFRSPWLDWWRIPCIWVYVASLLCLICQSINSFICFQQELSAQLNSDNAMATSGGSSLGYAPALGESPWSPLERTEDRYDYSGWFQPPSHT